MKNLKFLLVILFTLTIFSCSDETEVPNALSAEEQKDLIIDEALESSLLDDMLQDIDSYSTFGDGLKSAEETSCPSVTMEKPDEKPYWPRKVIVDYGEDCEKNGRIKSGKMIIEKSAPWYEKGSVRRVTFENYSVDGKFIDGVKEIENITEEGGNATFLIAGELVMEWSKNDTTEIRVQREFEKTQEWIIGFRDKEVKAEMILNGEAEIQKTINGKTKEVDKTYNDIKIVFGCKFPQSGVTEFEVKTFDDIDLEFALDYETEGDASEKCRENCDCIATLLIDGSDSEDIDLSERWWKQQKEKSNTDED